jgi:hypothetical protein
MRGTRQRENGKRKRKSAEEARNESPRSLAQNGKQQEHTVLKALITGYIVVMVIALIVVYIFNPYDPSQEGLKNFGVAGTIACTAISAIMTAFVSLITMTRNQDAARELEELKRGLAISQELYRIARQSYSELLAALDIAYSSLQQLESGGWQVGNYKTMVDSLAKVATLTVNCREKEHEELWEVARQRCVATGHKAEELANNKSGQAELWKLKVGPISEAINKFKGIVKVETRRVEDITSS